MTPLRTKQALEANGDGWDVILNNHVIPSDVASFIINLQKAYTDVRITGELMGSDARGTEVPGTVKLLKVNNVAAGYYMQDVVMGNSGVLATVGGGSTSGFSLLGYCTLKNSGRFNRLDTLISVSNQSFMTIQHRSLADFTDPSNRNLMVNSLITGVASGTAGPAIPKSITSLEITCSLLASTPNGIAAGSKITVLARG